MVTRIGVGRLTMTIASFIDSANGNFNLVPGTLAMTQGNPDLNNNGISWANDPKRSRFRRLKKWT